MSQAEIEAASAYLKATPIQVRCAQTPHIFDIQITAFRGEDSAFVRIVDYHTNLVCVRRNGETLLEKTCETQEEGLTDRSCLTIEGIVDFAETVELEDVRELLERQISYNMAIAEEGLRGNYGANIGKTVLRGRENDINYKMRGWAAAASDARMNGCELPVVINSGSGNQGITASVPVVVYARETGKSREELLRALCVSNLVTTHLKTGIGRLSAYCGAVSAGAGAGAGLAWLKGGRFEMIAHTVVNAVAVTSGIICDGAKASCAAKIAAAVDAGLLGLAMFEDGNQFFGGDGIVKKGVENTRYGSEGRGTGRRLCQRRAGAPRVVDRPHYLPPQLYSCHSAEYGAAGQGERGHQAHRQDGAELRYRGPQRRLLPAGEGPAPPLCVCGHRIQDPTLPGTRRARRGADRQGDRAPAPPHRP